jgi:hypothetical protein
MNKPGRNDPCPCGSGKKFKKCCEMQPAPKKINAQLLSGDSATKVSSLFFKKSPPKEEPPNVIL